MMMDEESKIKNLKKNIDELNEKRKISNNKQYKSSGLSFGFKIGIEIVAALMVGVVIGIYVDKYLNTKPFGLIIFFILGSLAGFLNVYRVMRQIDKN